MPALAEALTTVTPSAAKKELYLTQIISHIAKAEGAKISVSRVEEVFEALGINSRAELARATGVIRQRIIEMHLHNGVTIEDPNSTFIDYGVTIGADTTVRPYTVIETGVSIGKRCTIGPFARLRSGVAIGDEARVGNFAELVRTKVGPRVRMNHMSYLGDATVEEGVNIGAGTITANYDGKEKHPTHIGKGAFIGSDTVLIAPVKIGPGAMTGAGSVVTKAHDVPANRVAVGVPARVLDLQKPTATNGAKPKTAAKPKGKAAPRKAAAKAKPRASVKKALRAVRRPVKRAARRPATRKAKRR
jgi:bifunctional UDP-N-acetylglucosamine pyrophosphorylase/glucosamine-1-phosphate N-acetyltransferase